MSTYLSRFAPRDELRSPRHEPGFFGRQPAQRLLLPEPCHLAFRVLPGELGDPRHRLVEPRLSPDVRDDLRVSERLHSRPLRIGSLADKTLDFPYPSALEHSLRAFGDVPVKLPALDIESDLDERDLFA